MKQNIATRHTLLPQQIMKIGSMAWVAGMSWQVHDSEAKKILAFSHAGGATHRLKLSAKPQHITGLVRLTRVHPGGRFCSLAAAYLARAGGNHYGIYQLDIKRDKWLFLATSGGLPSVMGDVVGTLNEVLSAQRRFLDFNAPGSSVVLSCTATYETPVCWQTLTAGLPRQAIRTMTLSRVLSGRIFACFATLILLVSMALWYWNSQLDKAEMIEKAFQAKALLKLQSKNATDSVEVEKLSHPWAQVWPTSHFLRLCLVVRQLLPVTLAGWRLVHGECVGEGIRLRYEATPASTIIDFSRRVQELLEQEANFNLEEGGQYGDVFIPFVATDSSSLWRDEKIPASGVQLMQFISHFQRQNISVPLSDVKYPLVVPGQEMTRPPQEWREFTFIFTTKLPPEEVLASINDIGLRLNSIVFTFSPQSQFEYTLKGSLYAQK
ncbi:type 4b pilus protein PilO2 [Yersinia enterocolitica]|uniref:Type IV pilus protein n=1 Tax=Yersinia enterocolitica serotype O:8 / biotype 1B (strain NCTC 13174 / 8081) TaxID=393305 RepID=A1JQ44_YERE8|nr:type 4b pilus protein PilO2 [Yersinia enterocolitica]AJJ22511.1 pilin accessory family protein [Yersinia enterocolitica]CAL13526.1 putative type IV pilus protein [Yersinia enterocolitica subsp. enterocolitica 8081]CRY25024.1 putative type IV pilus protein [Yersinia enterocolitica]HDL8281350.1 type 4b pilus protein PilO2 [Yersinia enterocolitica]HDM8291221.1 type 4b pilus protein PilO2 [Yersinia enterocolitica]